LRVYGITGNEKLLSYAREKFDIYVRMTPKFRGSFVNFNSLLNNVRAEIIFQVCPGLMLLGRLSCDKKYCDIACEQAMKQMELLCDEKTGLWHHGRNEQVPSAAFWARGQAFVCHGLIETIEHAEILNPVRSILVSNFTRLVTEMCKLQDKSGFWYSVVTEPESEFESSGTAWMSACIFKAMRLGVLGPEFMLNAENAFKAVKSRIWQGSYPGHSLGTTVSKDYAYYSKRPLNTNGWTHFAFKAMCERMKMLKNQTM
jgi:unsaturated rhamnogalacturonyl hydrolase